MTDETHSAFDVRPFVVVNPEDVPSRTDPAKILCTYFHDGNDIGITWGGYVWWLDLGDIETPADLLWTVMSLGRKTWEDMTPSRMSGLIELVAKVKGWREFKPPSDPNHAPVPSEDVLRERARVTPQVRWSVLKRDGWRCRACGFSVQDGAALHVDHVKPVSKGGTSDIRNLQTLCTACNLGKSAS